MSPTRRRLPSAGAIGDVAILQNPLRCRNLLIYVVLWICTLRPFPNVLVDSVIGIDRVLDLLTLIVVLFFFTGNLTFHVRLRLPRGLQLPLLILAVLTVLLPVAYCNSMIVHKEPSGARDLFELLRFPIMLLLVFFLAQVRIDRDSLRGFIEKAYIIPFWIVAFLSFAEILKVPVVSEVKAILWAQSKNTLSFSSSWYRISGTMENPNWFSLYLNMILALFVFVRGRSLSSLAGILMCVCLLTFTGSVTGMVGLAFLMIAYCIISGFRAIRHPVGGVVRLAAAVLLIAVGLSMVSTVGNARILKAVRQVRSDGVLSIESASERASAAESLVDRYVQEPRLLGFGPSKYLLGSVIDNQYVEYLVRYGIVGTSLLLIMYIYFCTSAAALARRSNDRYIRDYSKCACVLTALLLIYFITGEFGDTLRLSILYHGLIVPIFLLARDPRDDWHGEDSSLGQPGDRDPEAAEEFEG